MSEKWGKRLENMGKIGKMGKMQGNRENCGKYTDCDIGN